MSDTFKPGLLNTEPRCACVLLLDTSNSMQGAPIKALNEALQTFKKDIQSDALTKSRVEVAVITFDSTVQVQRDFVEAVYFDPPVLTTSGMTHMGSGINRALDEIEKRKAYYRANDLKYYRPWVILITDGAPEGEPAEVIAAAAERIHREDVKRDPNTTLRPKVAFFTIAVEGADMARLASIAPAHRPPKKLQGLQFQELFLWLSSSLAGVSHSDPDANDSIPLPPTDSWAAV